MSGPAVYRLDAKEVTVAKLQELVGGYFDVELAVCDETDCPGHDMAVNGDGKALGLNYNSEATRLYAKGRLSRGILLGPHAADEVVGDVVLVTGGRID